ncbi:MAG: SAM-dependent methyltransferase [Crocinitomix sp.]|jgi:SAM-dependent methyltransferase
MKEWFESWFNTPYYHILYKNRDHSEAELFIRNLFDQLDVSKESTVLDLACGKGRHAVFVNSLGYNTTGVDLSSESIETAKLNESESLHFFQHDMREPIQDARFDLVLNLFTSFGYFQDTSHNEKMLDSIHTYLADSGKLVIDFFNVKKVMNELVESETKLIEDITFEISKTVENGAILKDIQFQDQGNKFHFQERVQALGIADFELMLARTNFEIEAIYGNYDLDQYESNSERLIIVAKKVKK